MKLHLCVLYPGGPKDKDSISLFLQEQLHDPMVQETLPSFLRSLWTWFLLYFRSKYPVLEGPCSSFQHAQKHTQELSRLLGSDFVCYPIHHFGQANLEAVIKSIPNKSRVVLIPLIPHRCQTLYSAVGQLRTKLQKKQCLLHEFGHYASKRPFIQALSTQIRKKIISSATSSYGLIFIEQRQPERWNKSSVEYKEDVERTMKAVIKDINTEQPYTLLHTHAKHWHQTLQDWKTRSVTTMITIPTSWIVSSELLRAEQHRIQQFAEELGMTCLHSDPVQSPLFDNFLVEKIRDIFDEIQQ